MADDGLGAVQSPFDYLSGLTRESATMVSSKEFVVLIRRIHRNGNQPAISVMITRFNNTRDPAEIYLIDKSGVRDMLLHHPFIIDMPPAPADFPANMSDKEIGDLIRLRAEKVAEFVKTVVDSRTSL